MAVREFDGSSDDIALAIGALSGMTHGTIGILLKPGTVAAGSRPTVVLHDSGGNGDHTGVGINADDIFYASDSSSNNSFFDDAAETDWIVLVVRKASGTATPRFTLYYYSSDDWASSAGDSSLANGGSPGAGGTVQFSFEELAFFDGRIAAMAMWSNDLPWSADASGDAAIEAAGLETSAANWLDASPDAMWLFNQAAVTTDVEDVTGNGADQTSRSGTNVVNGDDPPGFDFSLDAGATVEGTADLSLGGLTLSATGKRVVHGSSSITLGGLNLTATSQDEPVSTPRQRSVFAL